MITHLQMVTRKHALLIPMAMSFYYIHDRLNRAMIGYETMRGII